MNPQSKFDVEEVPVCPKEKIPLTLTYAYRHDGEDFYLARCAIENRLYRLKKNSEGKLIVLGDYY